VLEWIKPGILSTAGEEELGRGLARLHGAGAVAFGGQTPFRIGALTLSNDPCSSWAEFYVQRRLLPLAARIGETALLERVAARVEELCAPQAAPARLHGDLWRGNVLADQDGLPWLIDPAPYGGHHEVDLAMYELFGGRSKRVLAAYEEVSPLRDGYAERVALWQLFPLLVHAVLFGGSYVAAVREAAHRYV
jgi:fructosamine-3-kinase